MTDILPYLNYIIIGIIFSSTLLYVFLKIHSKNPSLLKPSLISHENTNRLETTYEWNLIISIFIACFTFALGIGIVSNLVIFMLTGKWYINSESTFVIVIVFIFFAFRELDKFVTSIFKK